MVLTPHTSAAIPIMSMAPHEKFLSYPRSKWGQVARTGAYTSKPWHWAKACWSSPMPLTFLNHKTCINVYCFSTFDRAFCVCISPKTNLRKKKRLWLYKPGKGLFSMHQEISKTFSDTFRCWQKHHHRENWRICEEELFSSWSYSRFQSHSSQFHFENCCETCTHRMKIFKFQRADRDRKYLFLVLEKA